MRTHFCNSCGNLLLPGLERCPNCRMPLDGSVTSWKPVSKAEGPKVVSTENSQAPYLPYEPRETQIQIISDIRNALDAGKHIVIESGTGTGKTITSLAGSLEHAKRTGKKVIYITRTISQSDQVMKELKAISTLKPVSGITLTGRNKSCPLLQAREDFDSLSPNALSMLCSDRKQKSIQGHSGGCPYYDNITQMRDMVEGFCKKNFPKSDEIDVYCRNLKVCPYELKKAMMEDFDVIVAPYIHIIDPDIRDNFLSSLGVEPENIVLIVDEAHNLMDAVREQESFTINMRLVGSAHDECMAFSSAYVDDGVTIGDFVKCCRNAMRNLGAKNLGFNKKEALLEPGAFEQAVCALLGVGTERLSIMVERLLELGEKREEAIADTEAPASPLLEFAELLKRWVKSPADRYVKAVKVNEDGEMLTASCIDPVDIAKFMNSLKGAVHMSGTLQPLDNYAKVLGLPMNSVPRTYPSPFPKENKKVIYSK
ncbi:MAG: DEAD/DEAH box helicase family protein, partial [archaeon]|nr:DEAD/DEAH box helicase family protein [archaeon]